MQRRLDQLSEEWRGIVAELAGDADVSTVSISEGGDRITLSLWVDDAPYLYVYERDPADGHYTLHALHALGQLKF